MRVSIVSIGLLFIGASHSALAHKTNPMLQYTMKAISADQKYVADPAKKPNPADVTDGQILAAVARSRTAAFQLQLLIDRRGSVDSNNKIIVDEFTPGGLDELPASKFKEMITLYADYLNKAKQKLVDSEALLKAEFVKASESRDFKALKKTMTELEVLIVDGHKAFRPEKEE